MSRWASRILALRLPHPEFVKRVSNIRELAAVRRLSEKIRSSDDYEPSDEGRGFLAAALSTGDRDLKNVALQQALSRSRAEPDIATFFKAAKVLSNNESDPNKRAEIIDSISREQIRVGQYYQAIQTLDSLPTSFAFEQSIELSLLLRDTPLLVRQIQKPQWKAVTPSIRASVHTYLLDLLDSQNPLPEGLASLLVGSPLEESALLTLIKHPYKLPKEAREVVAIQINRQCNPSSQSLPCRWKKNSALENDVKSIFSALDHTPASFVDVEGALKPFSQLVENYKGLQGNGDAELEALTSLRLFELYQGFGQFLNKSKLPEGGVSKVMSQKSREALETARQYQSRCIQIVQKNPPLRIIGKECVTSSQKSLGELRRPLLKQSTPGPQADPDQYPFLGVQQALFSSEPQPNPLLEFSELALQKGYVQHAIAASTIGITRFPETSQLFSTVLGCGLIRLGYLTEAQYRLRESDSRNGLRERCLSELKKSWDIL